VSELVYHLPISLWGGYRTRRVVLQAETTLELAEHWLPEAGDCVEYVRIFSPQGGAATRLPGDPSFPLDLYLRRPSEELGVLYEYSPLLRNRALRVSLPLVPGFSKAVKLGAALGYAVCLLPLQPDESLRRELLETLAFYLHHHSVQEPVEFFQGVLKAFFQNEPLTIWQVLEEDPARDRYVGPDGRENSGQRLSLLPPDTPPGNLISAFLKGLLAEGWECAGCEFRPVCQGYFKWPEREYVCHVPRAVFTALRQAAAELAAETAAACPASEGE
jgi:hypothetical protein